MAPLCSGCDLPSWLVIAKFHGEIPDNSASALEFLRAHGVLPREVSCPHCKRPCRLRPDRNMWYCPEFVVDPKSKKRKKCNFTISDYKDTFLSNAHVEPWKILLFINHWLEKTFDHHTVMKNLKFSSSTTVNWRMSCSKVTQFWLKNREPIGGQGIVVEIDVIHFGKRKDEQYQENQFMAFGGIEKESKKLFLVPFLVTKDEEHKDLVSPLIQQYICPGSVLVSESWGKYLKVKDHGYSHHIINHSKKFMDPKNSGKHTQNIKQLRQDVYGWVKRPGLRFEYSTQYFARYLFINQFKDNLLHHFLVEAARMYPPQSGCKAQRTLIISLFRLPASAVQNPDHADSTSIPSTETAATG